MRAVICSQKSHSDWFINNLYQVFTIRSDIGPAREGPSAEVIARESLSILSNFKIQITNTVYFLVPPMNKTTTKCTRYTIQYTMPNAHGFSKESKEVCNGWFQFLLLVQLIGIFFFPQRGSRASGISKFNQKKRGDGRSDRLLSLTASSSAIAERMSMRARWIPGSRRYVILFFFFLDTNLISCLS